MTPLLAAQIELTIFPFFKNYKIFLEICTQIYGRYIQVHIKNKKQNTVHIDNQSCQLSVWTTPHSKVTRPPFQTLAYFYTVNSQGKGDQCLG